MLVAAACSSDDSDSGTDTTAAATETTAAATETTAAATETTAATATTAPPTEKVDIDFWVAFSDEARLGFANDRAAEFNEKHPEYNVRVTSFASYNDAFDAAVLAVDSGEPPGLIHFFEAATRQALDAVGGDGNPIFKSVTDAIAGAGRSRLGRRCSTQLLHGGRFVLLDAVEHVDDGHVQQHGHAQ